MKKIKQEKKRIKRTLVERLFYTVQSEKAFEMRP